MERATLAEDYTISRIVVGCWQFSAGYGVPVTREQAVEYLNACVRAGITTFDCADIYTGAEELLGAFRAQYEHPIQIHTKFVPDLDALPTINRAYVERIIDRSLRRLCMDRLDLVQFHWWDWEIPGYLETAKHLADLQEAGKIRHIGVTNFDTPHLKELLDAGIKVVSNQVQYSVLDLRCDHMIDFCRKRGVRLLAYGTLAGGFISDRWLGKPEPTEFENRSLAKYKLIIDDAGGWEVLQKILAVLDKLAKYFGVSLSAVAQRFVFDHRYQSPVAGIIVGGSVSRAPHRLGEPFWPTGRTLLAIEVIRGHMCGAIPEDLEEIPGFTLDQKAIDYIIGHLLWFWNGTYGLPGDIYSLERVKGGKHAGIMRYNLNEGP